MTVTLNGTNGVTFNDGSAQSTAATGFGFKNRIINGAMVIDQRNAGASVTPTDGTYTLDRWLARQTTSGKFSVQQNAGAVTPPTGYINYLGCTSLSAYTVLSTDVYAVVQNIEGLNVADLAWGTASAASVTISFWVRSSLTGTFGGSIRNSATNRTYPFSYTISSANTWEQKTVTVAGDTSGTWLTTNGIGLQLIFAIGVGSTYSGTAGSWSSTNYLSATGAVSVVGTNGATFYITGVQLEKGSTATSFDFRSYGQELLLCQRYFEVDIPIGWTNPATSVALQVGGIFKVTKRAAPTCTITSQALYGPLSSPSVTGASAERATASAASPMPGANAVMNLAFSASAEL